MVHLFPGSNGLFVGLAIFPLIWVPIYSTRKHEAYNLDPQGKWGAFEPFLAKYLRVSEFIIGLATGSIVLLVGSSALHGPIGKVPSEYSSPAVPARGVRWLRNHIHGVAHIPLRRPPTWR